MQASCKETEKVFIKLEAEMNKKLHSITNSLSFISLCGEALEEHLNQVTLIRQLSSEWLACRNLPNRDETAAIAQKKIQYEDRIDRMDDQLYETTLGINKYRSNLAVLSREAAALIAGLDDKNKSKRPEESNMVEKVKDAKKEVTEEKVVNEFNLEHDVTAKLVDVKEPEVMDVVELMEEPKVEELQDAPEAIYEEAEPLIKDEQLTSLEMLWKHALQELDAWAKRADYRDEIFLKAAKDFSERVSKNRDNIQEITVQFSKEMSEWERSAREEFLMSTTTLQHFFSVRSYEDINQMVDDFQSRAASLMNTPLRSVTSLDAMDKFIEMIEQYMSMRKNGRMQYIRSVKQTANVVYENQKVFVNLFSKQIKTLLFPFNKYMEK